MQKLLKVILVTKLTKNKFGCKFERFYLHFFPNLSEFLKTFKGFHHNMDSLRVTFNQIKETPFQRIYQVTYQHEICIQKKSIQWKGPTPFLKEIIKLIEL